jgi:ketosteroid isomerase-like protein
MKRLPLLLTLLLVSTLASTQNINNQKAINDQVWKPFIQNFNTGNADGFMSVHSTDLVRVPRDAKTLSDFVQYKKQIESSGKSSKRTIEIRFTERIATDTKASEAGIYKTTFVTPQGETKTLYGKFLVILRKENGAWKILVDTDTSEGGTVNEEAFRAAQPI